MKAKRWQADHTSVQQAIEEREKKKKKRQQK